MSDVLSIKNKGPLALEVRGVIATQKSADDLVHDFAKRIEDEFRKLDVKTKLQHDHSPNAVVHALELHPAAPAILLESKQSQLRLHADTGLMGPGYHHFLRDLITEHLLPHLTETQLFGFDSSYEDDCQTSLELLQDAARSMMQAENPNARFTLHMPAHMQVDWAFLPHKNKDDAKLITSMGPRSASWISKVAEDAHAGIDVFPCWNLVKLQNSENQNGEIDPAFYRGLALSSLWLDTAFRKPVNDEERAQMEQTLRWLERAFAASKDHAKLDWPWNEWAELYSLLEVESLLSTRAQMNASLASEAPAGYRRGRLQHDLGGGFSMWLPGSFREHWEDTSFIATNGELTLFATTYSESDSGDQKTQDSVRDSRDVIVELPELPGDSELVGLENNLLLLEGRSGPALSEDRSVEEGKDSDFGKRMYAFHGACGPSVAVMTFLYEDANQEKEILELAAGLDHALNRR